MKSWPKTLGLNQFLLLFCKKIDFAENDKILVRSKIL